MTEHTGEPRLPLQMLASAPADWAETPAHPAADVFPMLGPAALAELVNSIEQNGFYSHYPIVLVRNEAGQWVIVDGRNRREALRRLRDQGQLPDAMPVFAELGEGVNPIDYIAAVNLQRRDLGPAQKAMIAQRLISLDERAAAQERMRFGKKIETDPAQKVEQGATKGRVADQAATKYGINRQYVYDAAAIDAADKTLGDLVVAGTVGLGDAKQLHQLGKANPELAAQVQQQITRLHAEKQADPEAARKRVKQAIQGALNEQKRRERPNFRDGGALPAGKWNLILADPPWEYDFVPEESNAIENQYPTMDRDAIVALPVADLAAADSVLFLWTTSPKLQEGLAVLNAWGFRYVTSWIWQKTGGAPGMGYWARIDHEILLIGTRGNPGAPDKADMQFSSVIAAPKGKHSEKPAIFYPLIEKVKSLSQ